jgi:hypothetical protein
VLVLGEDVDLHAAGDGRPVDLDVLEQPARDEARLDDLGHVRSPVISRRQLGDQDHRVGGRLGVVLDDDVLDLVRRCYSRRRPQDQEDEERERDPTHAIEYRT